MSFVLGRAGDAEDGPIGSLGTYRALDGSDGAPLGLDLDGPHAISIVGKRGYGKSYTLGVIAESLSRVRGVAPVVIDPMGVFDTLTEPTDGESVPATVVKNPAVTPSSLDPRSWCSMLGLSPESGAGGLVWQAAGESTSLDEMRAAIEATEAPTVDTRAAINHIDLADSWDVFDADGITAGELGSAEITVIDVSEFDSAPMNAVARGIGETLYRARVDGEINRLPWLLIDEAHTFFEGIAQSAVETILTRGRAPGVSLVTATQRPSAVPDVGISQSDILIAHRLTSETDLDALAAAQPTYVKSPLAERLPTETGEVIIIDDSTETVHTAKIRRRATPHDGESPSASNVVCDD